MARTVEILLGNEVPKPLRIDVMVMRKPMKKQPKVWEL
jgi:hypothetical protein